MDVLRTSARAISEAPNADRLVEELALDLNPHGVIVVNVDDGAVPSISSLAALDRLFARHGLLIVDVERLPGCRLLAVQHHDVSDSTDRALAAVAAA